MKPRGEEYTKSRGVVGEMEINTRSDALSFLYNFEKYAERESNGSYLFMFPYEDSNGIDVFGIYKDTTRELWSLVGEELSPGVYAVENVDMRSLVDYVMNYKTHVNFGINELLM
ncbi:hypothetical protein D3C81_767790 [compost metagenome]